MKQYKPKEFSEMLNVSVKTLQSWDNQGVLPAYRNQKGRRYSTEEQEDILYLYFANWKKWQQS